MKALFVISILLHSVVSAAGIPWDVAPLSEIPAIGINPVIPLTSDNIHKGTYFSSVQGDDADFVAWVPGAFDINKTYHLVLFLGGGSGSAYQFAFYSESLDSIMSNAVFENYIIVSPDADNWGLWGMIPTFDGPAVVSELRDYIQSNIKTDKVFVIGHSNGGAGAINLAFTHGTEYGAVAAISPSIPKWSPFQANNHLQEIEQFAKDHAPQMPANFFIGALELMTKSFETESNWNQFDPYLHITNSRLEVPLKIFSGSQDPLGFAFLAQEYVSYAKSNGVVIEHYEDPARDHEVGIAILESIQYFELK